MKMSFKISLFSGLLFAGLLFISCNKSSVIEPPDAFSWELVYSTSPDSDLKGKPPIAYLLSFERSSGSLGLTLDVNSCGTDYVLEGDEIILDPLFCTRICCDTPYANLFIAALSNSRFKWIQTHSGLLLKNNEYSFYFRRN